MWEQPLLPPRLLACQRGRHRRLQQPRQQPRQQLVLAEDLLDKLLLLQPPLLPRQGPLQQVQLRQLLQQLRQRQALHLQHQQPLQVQLQLPLVEEDLVLLWRLLLLLRQLLPGLQEQLQPRQRQLLLPRLAVILRS